MSKNKTVLGLLLFGAWTLWGADNRPIGVFDSGTGGLTVLEKMVTDDFAHEKFVYLGDQANMPYGDYAAAGKSDFLRGLVIRDAEFLLAKDAKIIVIACNTATAYGYDAVARLLEKRGDGTKVIGVVNAGARSVIRQLDLVRNPRPCAIGVMATPGTIASGVYERTVKSELARLGVTCDVRVFSRGCAGLADAVEAGSAAAPKIACDNLKALLTEHREKAPDIPLRAVILGCTHFPFVQRELEKVAPKGVTFVDPAVDTAAECAAALKAQDRQTDAKTPLAVETYVSVAAPGLDPSKLDDRGGLTRQWKYGRTDAASDRSTVPVPIGEATKGDPLKFIPFAHMIPRVRALLVESASGPAAEAQADAIVADILAEVAKVRAADPSVEPIAFWDFDGTVIKGDISTGLVENGRERYPGLFRTAVEAGFSPIYQGAEGATKFLTDDYPRLQEFGRFVAWPALGQAFHGADVSRFLACCRAHADKVLKPWVFAASQKIIDALAKAGVENQIVSGSPDLFVKAAAPIAGIPPEHAVGNRLKTVGGRLSTELVYPLSMNEGKVDVIREILKARPHALPVAAFGNSYWTDGPFMRYVATLPLPGGAKGTAVMFNGAGDPTPYRGYFRCLTATATVGRRLGESEK